ncbi:MAG: DNA-deoxyinosine glycosylase [Alcanivorax sp.]|jgi:double-stranded uracil-DNA glycosylase|nr:DNA-deoxyinosine glycosylase [Alcanivorax sp.]
MSYIHSFPPISDPAADRLILGSMPGKASLAANQYYAHPRNLFWPIIETLFDIPADLPYAERCRQLAEQGVALWDVLRTCTRSSSLDSDIVEGSIIAQDFEGFLRAHPRIGVVFFNGAKAESVYLRHVRPVLPGDLAAVPTVRLPSTSPANASIPYPVKLRQWQAVTTPL